MSVVEVVFLVLGASVVHAGVLVVALQWRLEKWAKALPQQLRKQLLSCRQREWRVTRGKDFEEKESGVTDNRSVVVETVKKIRRESENEEGYLWLNGKLLSAPPKEKVSGEPI